MNKFREILNIGKSRYFLVNQSRSVLQKTSQSEDTSFLSKQEPQLSQISSGIAVASIENYSPVSHVSVAVKAGSRFEIAENSGISHCLRNCAVLSTQNRTAFAATRSLERVGAKLSVSGTREHLIYSLECARDNIETGLEVLADVLSSPTFKTWEVEEAAERVRMDLALHAKNPESVLVDALHKAAYRGGLANTLFMQPFMVGKHSPEMLHSFVAENFAASRTCVVALGLPQEDLERALAPRLTTLGGHSGKAEEASKFAPGEVRIESDLPFVHVGIVAEGASASSVKDVLCFGVLQCLLGSGGHVNGSGAEFSKLGEVAHKKVAGPFHVSAINFSYSGTGLFGAYVVGRPGDMGELVRGVVAQMRSTSKAVTDSTVQTAKHKLKARLLMERDTSPLLASCAALDLSHLGTIRSGPQLEKSIDELKTADIQAVAARVVKAKPAMAAVGRLESTPHVDELL